MQRNQIPRPATFANALLHRMSPDHPTVVVSPVLWQPDPKQPDGPRQWYFLIAMFDPALDRCAWDMVILPPDDFSRSRGPASLLERQDTHRAAILALTQHRPPLVIHTFDDELDMARWCEAAWPGPHITEIRQDIERERAEWAAAKSRANKSAKQAPDTPTPR